MKIDPFLLNPISYEKPVFIEAKAEP